MIFLACYLTGVVVTGVMFLLLEGPWDVCRHIEIAIWPLALTVGLVRLAFDRKARLALGRKTWR